MTQITGVVPELGEFIIANSSKLQGCSEDEFNRLLTSIKLAAKLVNREISQAGLVDILGAVGGENVQGEQQQKLDVFANVKFMHALRQREVVCGICSEEDDNFIRVNDNCSFVISMDPLDGSSNIDVNVSVGTIFSIYKRLSPVGSPVEASDFMQPGTAQICAGYVLYGACTQLVITTGNGVQGFTLDPSIGTFFLSHPRITIPEDYRADTFSVNMGNFETFPEGVHSFLDWCQSDRDTRYKDESEEFRAAASNHLSPGPCKLRYIGSLVSDFHRNLLTGGLYMYPPTSKHRKGKLRLLYECNPVAFLAEQAGGAATDGYRRLLEVQPTSLHQRVTIFVGSKLMVEKATKMMKELSPDYDPQNA